MTTTSSPPSPVATPTAAVVLRGLRKNFDGKAAVDGLDLTVPRGSFFGLVGPNGAGKSSTLKISTGLMRPDAGTAVVDGIDVWTNPQAVKARIGVVPEELRLFERLTGRELLEYTALLRGLDQDQARRRTSDLLEVLDLTDSAGQLVIDYSTGMRKKIALGSAVLHRPSVLFLDEPFESVDPLSVRALRSLLEQMVHGGATVIFSSHVMEVVEGLCDNVAVMNAGRIVAGGPVSELCADKRLEDVFVDAIGLTSNNVDLTWLGEDE